MMLAKKTIKLVLFIHHLPRSFPFLDFQAELSVNVYDEDYDSNDHVSMRKKENKEGEKINLPIRELLPG